ncbi:MAG: hypothetical protein GX289_11090 [Tissierellia bacterium]|jgi:hypothetical protein|nr:hypothetical protein [Tissierellia bacterium]
MKRIIIIVLCLVLGLWLLIGCSNNDTNQPDNKETPSYNEVDEPEADEEFDEAMEELGEALSYLATPGWPEGKIPDVIPEYPFGEVTNSGDGGDGQYFILISPTGKDELAEYLTLLEGQGFTVSGDDSARLGTVAVNFQFNTKEVLQMIVTDLGTSEWPQLMGDVLPPDAGTLYGEVYIAELSKSDKEYGNYYSAGFTLVDLTEEDCVAFIEKQLSNGWEGGYDMIFKDVTIDGVDCELMLQFVQYYDGQGDFLLEAWKKQ